MNSPQKNAPAFPPLPDPMPPHPRPRTFFDTVDDVHLLNAPTGEEAEALLAQDDEEDPDC